MSSLIPDNVPHSFIELMDSCSLNQKKAMLVALNNSIKKDIDEVSRSEINIKQYVDHVKGFLPDNFFDEGIISECSELGLLRTGTNKPITQWLSSDDRDYGFSNNKKFSHPPKDIKKYPHIGQLMEMVNRDPRTTKNADSALIIVYNSEHAGINWHNDGEDLIDGNSSISTVSFGVARNIEFCDRAKHPRTAEHSLVADNHDLMIMKPSCQEHLVHQVCRANPSNGKWRIVLSFRKISEDTRDPEVSFDATKVLNGDAPRRSTAPSPPIKVCLIAGDSFSSGLDEQRLSRGKYRKVVNLSQPGSNIQGVSEQLDNFYLSNSPQNVDKVFICVGANDIRNCRDNGVRHLKSPLIQLAEHIKTLFTGATVWFQCLLPLPLQHEFSVQNVEQYNGLLYEVCSYTNCYFHDIFEGFLEYNYYEDCFYRNEYLFVSGKNIHLNKIGLGKLASRYLRLIYSNKFNPLGY